MGTKPDSFFISIGFVALDATLLDVTCWNGSAALRLLGCSMKEYPPGFVAEGSNDKLLSSDELKEMTGLLKKRQGLVNLTTKGPYSRDSKKHINLVSFEWVVE